MTDTSDKSAQNERPVARLVGFVSKIVTRGGVIWAGVVTFINRDMFDEYCSAGFDNPADAYDFCRKTAEDVAEGGHDVEFDMIDGDKLHFEGIGDFMGDIALPLTVIGIGLMLYLLSRADQDKEPGHPSSQSGPASTAQPA
mgnify:CR=1 FL=1